MQDTGLTVGNPHIGLTVGDPHIGLTVDYPWPYPTHGVGFPWWQPCPSLPPQTVELRTERATPAHDVEPLAVPWVAAAELASLEAVVDDLLRWLDAALEEE